MNKRSFSQGVGEWIGAAEVYDADGRFAGMGSDTRTVKADDQAGRVTVEVEFDGPFSLSGVYTITDHGSHRTYEGPLNIGYAEALGDDLVAAHNYWPGLGLSQRFFLMVLPGGTRQLSLALLSRGDQLQWTVVGEYQRQVDPSDPVPLPVVEMDPQELRADPTGGRGELLLLRPGRWSGQLHRLDADYTPTGSADFTETVGGRGDTREVVLSGADYSTGFSFNLRSDGWTAWTPECDLMGSGSLSGGRGFSGQFHLRSQGLRVWRREVVSRDGAIKAVLHIWYRGEQRLGAAYGALAFEPA
ncbi:hypothetical protein [Candidatus Poriferisocius sp.]|uniref:hypothetical protein n=1 Tax=Candidatus Poriferisocius sp. TaxID=3101276 RepID=UPI003B51E11B